MAADLARFAAGEPVSVRAAGPLERSYKWARRKPTVAAAWALGLAAVGFGGGGAGVGWLWQEAEAARVQLAGEKEQTDDALTREQTARVGERAARTQADAARRDAEAARDLAAAEQRKAEAARGDAVTARDQAAVGRTQAEEAFAREKSAKTQETEARRVAEEAFARERAALDKLNAVQYARTVDLAHREYRANDLPRANRLLAECPLDRRGWEWQYVNRLCNAEHLKIDAKAGHAYAVAYDPTGMRLVTAHADGKARLWSAADGKPLGVLDGHKDEVLDATFTPDGRRVVTASADGTVKVWDADTHKELATLTDPSDDPKVVPTGVYTVAVSPEGQNVSAGGKDGKLRMWRLDGGNLTSVRDGGVGEIQAVRYSPDGKWVAAAGRSGGVRVWERRTDKPPIELTAGPDAIAALAFSPSGGLAVGGADGLVRVWNIGDQRLTLAVQTHPGGVTGVAFTPDGKRLVTGGRDRAVAVWDAATGRPSATFKGHTDSAWDVVIDAAGTKAVAAGLDGTVREWKLSDGQDWKSIPVDPAGLTAFAVAPDEKWLVAGGKTGKVSLVDLTAGPVAPSTEQQPRSDRGNDVENRFAGPAVFVRSDAPSVAKPVPPRSDENPPTSGRPNFKLVEREENPPRVRSAPPADTRSGVFGGRVPPDRRSSQLVPLFGGSQGRTNFNQPTPGRSPPAGRESPPKTAEAPTDRDAAAAGILAVGLRDRGSNRWRVACIDADQQATFREVKATGPRPVLYEVNPRGKPPNNRDPGEYGSAAALADGLAATGRPNGTVVVTGTADGKWEFAAHPNGVGALAFDAGGKRLVVGSTAAITPGRVRGRQDPAGR